MISDKESKNLLINLLQEAAQIEHCLLNTYLYTACSLKTLPEEFFDFDGIENRRRAIYFERVRKWKQSLLSIAKEEMLHLHYVQCLLRALGEPPSFSLPQRDIKNGNWVIPNWKPIIENKNDELKGVQIPLSPLSLKTIRQFVLYESTDSLQEEDPFDDKSMKLFNKLKEFEQDLHFESILYNIDDVTLHNNIKTNLINLFKIIPISEEKIKKELVISEKPTDKLLPSIEELRFQSISELYYKGILPLYKQAFDFGWIKYSNIDLNNELRDQYAREGLLPIVPIYRTLNFQQLYRRNVDDPLLTFQNFQDIIREIVEEGEGNTKFENQATILLEKIQEFRGTKKYLDFTLNDRRQRSNPNYKSPDWLIQTENLRQSHLYRFIIIMMELEEETKLAKKSGVKFEPFRQPLTFDSNNHGLNQMIDALPYQFNACYLVLLIWLTRMYNLSNWNEDKTNRQVIQMLASWPFMSLIIRPFLELLSFFPVNLQILFRIDKDSITKTPIYAQQLLQIYNNRERSNEINQRIDYLALHILEDIANWCKDQQEIIEKLDIHFTTKEMIITRLQALTDLEEFQKQFQFRVHGGYSNKLPDVAYQLSQTDFNKFSEDPSTIQIFKDTLVLRLRFSGWGRVQLATDPDPPSEEIGCTGTHMLHATDSGKRFDRSLIWQQNNTNIISREPLDTMPTLGVNCVDISILITDNNSIAGYVPLSEITSSESIQESVSHKLEVYGLLDLFSLPSEKILDKGKKIRIDLLHKNGMKPALQGLNHLISRDGEPIDPFIITVLADSDLDNNQISKHTLFTREIFNHDNTFRDMSPLQRVFSARWPCGFDSYDNIPTWVFNQLSENERNFLKSQNYPISYLINRAKILGNRIIDTPIETGSQKEIDTIISLSQRMLNVSIPRSTTVGWLRILLHYGHTISGKLEMDDNENPIFKSVENNTNLDLAINDELVSDRDLPNSRWLVRYTMGIMDTDALSNLIFGELYVPLKIKNFASLIKLVKTWNFSINMKSVVSDYACKFDKPFWSQFEIIDEKRIFHLDDQIVTEILLHQENDFYKYTITGFPGLAEFNGSFKLVDLDHSNQYLTLEWNISFKCDSSQDVIRFLTYYGRTVQNMTENLKTYFGPQFE